MHASTWRVGDDDIWATVLMDEVFRKDVFHVTCIEERIVYFINLRIDLCVFYSFWNILNTNNLFGLLGDEIGYGSRSCIQVVNKFVTCKVSKLARYRIKMLCLFGIGLIEALWSHLKLQVLHRLKDMVISLEESEVEIVKGVVTFLIINVEE